MGILSRRKGARFERELVRIFAEVFGEQNVRRGLQFRDGADAPDVIAPALWIEGKCGKRTNPRAALRQAREASSGKGLPCVAVCKDDREEPFIAMELSDFSGPPQRVVGREATMSHGPEQVAARSSTRTRSL